jgi:hypothetical protein
MVWLIVMWVLLMPLWYVATREVIKMDFGKWTIHDRACVMAFVLALGPVCPVVCLLMSSLFGDSDRPAKW